MKKQNIPLLVALMIGVSSCGDVKEKSQNADKNAGVVNARSIEPVLFFKAGGNEPGWNLVMTASESGTFPVILVLDYGADTLTGTIQKMPIMEQTEDGAGRPTVGSNEVKYTGILDAHGSPEKLEMSIVSGICADDADKQHGTSVTISVADQHLRGCGDYFE